MIINPRHHIALFESAIIALDIQHGKYLLYDNKVAKALGACLVSGQIENTSASLSPLLDDGVLVNNTDCTSDEKICDYRQLKYQIFSSELWSARQLSGRETSNFNIRFIIRLTWNAILLRTRGFYALNKLKRFKRVDPSGWNETAIRALKIPEKFLQASLWSPLPIACLQMSFAITEELRRHGVPAQLVIGVRPLPFVAHAWVEVDGIVHGDEASLPDLYGEIYRIPEA